MSREKPWHIAIVHDEYYSPLVIYDFSRNLEQYCDAIKFQEDRDREIVAECNELSDEDMDRITGAIIAGSDDSGVGAVIVGPENLRNLIRRLNSCKGLNPQEELIKLYRGKP